MQFQKLMQFYQFQSVHQGLTTITDTCSILHKASTTKISVLFKNLLEQGQIHLLLNCKEKKDLWYSHDVPGGSDGKASAYNAGDPGSIPGWGRSSGEGNSKPLQYSCLENPMDGGAW